MAKRKSAARSRYLGEAARLVEMMRYGYPEAEVAAQAERVRDAREQSAYCYKPSCSHSAVSDGLCEFHAAGTVKWIEVSR